MGLVGLGDGWMRTAGVKRPPRLGIHQPPNLGCDCAYPYCEAAAIGPNIAYVRTCWLSGVISDLVTLFRGAIMVAVCQSA